jgi:hypothetical protein
VRVECERKGRCFTNKLKRVIILTKIFTFWWWHRPSHIRKEGCIEGISRIHILTCRNSPCERKSGENFGIESEVNKEEDNLEWGEINLHNSLQVRFSTRTRRFLSLTFPSILSQIQTHHWPAIQPQRRASVLLCSETKNYKNRLKDRRYPFNHGKCECKTTVTDLSDSDICLIVSFEMFDRTYDLFLSKRTRRI